MAAIAGGGRWAGASSNSRQRAYCDDLAQRARSSRGLSGAGLIVSWLPDLAIWATAVFPGTTTSGILSLMALHVVAAGLAVGILLRFGLTSE